MNSISTYLVSTALALAPLPAILPAALNASHALAPADAAADLAAVTAAAQAAAARVTAEGYGANAMASAFERELPDALAFSTADDVTYVLYHDAAFTFTLAKNGNSYTAEYCNPASTTLPVYDSLEAAKAANASTASFITRGLTAKGDHGHGYYTKVASLAEGQPGVTIGTNAYALTSAEGAVTPYQLGYTAATNSVSAAINAFHASGFHTLAFPKGEYRLTEEIWSHYDNRSYLGFDATLFTDSSITRDGKNNPHNALWIVRGFVEWNVDHETRGWGITGNYTVRNVEIAGFNVERRDGSANYRYLLVVRNARNVSLNACDLHPTLGGLGVDLYGDYDGVNITNSVLDCVEIRDLCNHVNNHPSNFVFDDDNPDGGRNVVVRGCSFTTYSFDEGLPIFAGNEQGLGSVKEGVFTEYPILNNCLIENVLVENNHFTMAAAPTEKQRVVAITCGYQDSPVKNVRIEHNEFDVYANNYLILFGWAEDCSFSHNNVTVRSTSDKPTLVPVIRATHSRTGPTKTVRFEHNTINFPEEKATVARMVDSALGKGAVTFSHNDVTVAGTTSRVFDSTAEATNNSFHLNEVGYLYDRVGEVSHNSYEVNKISGLYQSYDTNAQADLNIHDETARIGELTSNLLSFNGTPKYNGHSLSFTDCVYDIANASRDWHHIAYGTSNIVDSLNLSFNNCYLPGFDTATKQRNTIQQNDSGKVSLTITEAPVLQLVSAESVGAAGYADISTSTTLTPTSTAYVSAKATVPALSGEVVGGFDLTIPASVTDAELVLRPASTAATVGDVLAIYRWDGAAWQLVAYAEVHGGRFTLNLAQSGSYAVVNKAKGSAPVPTLIPLNPTDTTWREKNNLFGPLKAPGVYSASGSVSFPELSTSEASPNSEFVDMTFEGMGATSVLRVANSTGGPNHLYFSGCTFNNVEFNLLSPGTYVFNNCEFKDNAECPLVAKVAGVHVYVFNSSIHDNKPPKAEWNANASSERSWKYPAVALRANDATAHLFATTIENYQTNPTVFVEANHTGNALYVEHCAVRRSGGCGISINSPVRGRIDHNEFTEIGALRGQDGYEASADATFAFTFANGTKGTGRGVGGNAVFAATGVTCFGMRVRDNSIHKVMENGIEGHFWCVDNNSIDTTGYRWDEGFDTVSTEGIWGGSRFVRNNRLVRTHSHGIVVQRRSFATGAVEVSGNTIDKAGWGLTHDVEGIRVVAGGDTSGSPVSVHDNSIAGYAQTTRVINPQTSIAVTFTNNADHTIGARAEGQAVDPAPVPGGEDRPATSDAPATAASPSTPASAATPGTPATAETPATAATPDTPGTAHAPSTAATPDTAHAPESPSDASTPATAQDPDVPAAFKPGWRWGITGWYWEKAPATKATGWLWDGGAWYYFDNRGVLVSGWVWESGDWFYLNEGHDGTFGAMVTGWHADRDGWYWLNVDPSLRPSGAMARSTWVFDRGSWYYAGPGGVLLAGWQWIDGAWYCLAPDGRLYVNTLTPDGQRVDGSGRWVP